MEIRKILLRTDKVKYIVVPKSSDLNAGEFVILVKIDENNQNLKVYNKLIIDIKNKKMENKDLERKNNELKRKIDEKMRKEVEQNARKKGN